MLIPSRARSLALVALFLPQLACTRAVAPPPSPPPTMPALEDVPPEPESGMARVLISTDVPARVERITTGVASRGYRRSASVRLDDLLCESTPCAVTLPYGDHEIAFRGLTKELRHGSTTIHVRKPTEVVNHTLGSSSLNAAQGIGAFVAITGAVVLGIGLGLIASEQKQRRGISETATNLTIAGVSATFGGLVLMAAFPGTHQEGSTTQWSPPIQGRTIGGGLGVKF